MSDDPSFDSRFEALTGHGPFHWQVALHEAFRQGKLPDACDIPTGLGKTSIIPIWLIALAAGVGGIPRRLVYVVNRRTIVDQSTAEAEQIRERLRLPDSGELPPEILAIRRGLDVQGDSDPLAISTLRGQFADNREWSADPSRPAVIVGTIDMIGSRLLFGGYGLGFKTRPLHAGFLGQDALLVHDEAHLEPAFQKLVEAIRDEQKREPSPLGEAMRLKVMALTATPRVGGIVLKLTEEDRAHPEVKKRIQAKKLVELHPLEEYDAKDKLADVLANRALAHKDSRRAVLVFARTVEVVEKVAEKLRKQRETRTLTGTMRGKERDGLTTDPVFVRFLHGSDPHGDTVYLVCTSAGEVGVNISADDLVCDLSTFESMAQRFGRVNRFGKQADTRIDVVHPLEFGDKDPIKDQLQKTLDLLIKLEGDGSPEALGQFKREVRLAAFSPDPKMMETSDILFDAWSLTTIRDELPGRPPLEPYLHGLSERELPETQVAWREEVWELRRLDLTDERLAEFLDDFQLKPHELLRDRSDRVFKHIEAIAKRFPADPEIPAWLIDRKGNIRPTTIHKLADKDRKDQINSCTLLLPTFVGGLREGLMDGNSKGVVRDVSSEWPDAVKPRRSRIWDNQKVPDGMRLIRTIDTKTEGDDTEEEVGIIDGPSPIEGEPVQGMDAGEAESDSSVRRYWHWYELPKAADNEGSETAKGSVLWQVHTNDVIRNATAIVENLAIPDRLKEVVILAAVHHDLGKKRPIFQRGLGNTDATQLLAKSGKKKRSFNLGGKFRHEFGSLLDFREQAEIKRLGEDLIELVEHLMAAHHGRGRPHFPLDEVFDPGHAKDDVDRIASEVPGRFARLQRKYGRWGLAYLESLLRAADYAASAGPSEFVEDKP